MVVRIKDPASPARHRKESLLSRCGQVNLKSPARHRKVKLAQPLRAGKS